MKCILSSLTKNPDHLLTSVYIYIRKTKKITIAISKDHLIITTICKEKSLKKTQIGMLIDNALYTK